MMTMTYYPFTEKHALDYARALPDLFDPDAELVCSEIGDGNLNLVFRISGQSSAAGQHNGPRSVIIKQALPHLRVLSSWPLTLHRAEIEFMALKKQKELCPDHVPEVYHFDGELALIIMEDLNRHLILRKGFISRSLYPNAAGHIGRFLGTTLFATSDLGMNPGEKKRQVAAFVNPELCKITEDLIFTDPFYNAPLNRYNEKIGQDVQALWKDDALKLEAAVLKQKFSTEAQALLHGDLHTGSVMVNEKETMIIDPEFAFYGPMGFDIGAIMANILLSYAAQPGYGGGREMEGYRNALMEMLAQIWSEFEAIFTRLWQQRSLEYWARLESYRKHYLAEVFADSLGFAGCKMIRRIVGLAHVEDMESIGDHELRANCERLAIQIGRMLILQRRKLPGTADVVEAVRLLAGGGTADEC